MFWRVLPILFANSVISIMAGLASYYFMWQYIPIFIQRKLYGIDQCKLEKKPVPEPIGVISAAIYLIFLFTSIPIPFYDLINKRAIFAGIEGMPDVECHNTEYVNLLTLLAGLVSIFTAVLLGFADDMLDLRWRHKLLFPTLSSLPLMLVYLLTKNPTAILLPKFIVNLYGYSYYDLGPLYYLYMVALVIFCTNAVNIIAGINGVEVGQSIIIGSSIAVFNIIQIFRSIEPTQTWHQVLSLCFILPFIGTSIALYAINKYPAQAFVGDTYCYWAGMTIAVCALTGRFSKTLLLFLLPQILNFLYSCPQLFNLIPCPRHRLPRFNRDKGILEMSIVEFQPEKLSWSGRICLTLLRFTRLVEYSDYDKDGERWATMNNLTILNFILRITGPIYEWELTNRFLIIQLASSLFAFTCRFIFAKLFYDQVH